MLLTDLMKQVLLPFKAAWVWMFTYSVLVYRVFCTLKTLKLNVFSYLYMQLACTCLCGHVPWGFYLFIFLLICFSLLFFFFFHHNRTEQVYRFFQQWCPNIHNATDEESDDDMASPGCCAADEEVGVVDLTCWLHVAVMHSKILTFL